MKKSFMIGGGVVGALVIIVIVAVTFLLSNLDGLIKEAVEKYGSEATKAQVSLNKVEISLTSGSGALSGLKVGNPAGFKTPSAFELGGISIKLDVDSVGKDPIVIKEIVISKPQVTYELDGTNSNIDAIQKNVDAYSKQFGGGGGAKKSEGEGPKMIIENIYIRGGEISVSAGFLAGKKMTAALPDIHLKDVGKEEKGADPAEVIQKVIGSMTEGIGSAVSGLGLEDLAKGVTEGAAAAAKKLQEGAGSAGSAVQEGVGEAGKSLKKLFGQ
ncbi:MAG TPA: hypothetical protein QGH84_03595 [Rhodospirillales bacterium]|nr:hypothetical protein [Rhodospirillales bacterium]